MTNRSIFPPWAIDRHTQIVIRSRQAVHLGYIQFAIFRELHEMGRRAAYSLPSQELADRVYAGGKNPKTLSTIHVIVRQANRKIAHLKLKIRGVNRGHNSFYQIVPLDCDLYSRFAFHNAALEK